jgi:hypothetical protein
MADIGEEYRATLEARRLKMKELLSDYDKTVYYPAVSAIRARCEAEGGHVKSSAGKFFNGLGWCWDYCGRCKARFNVEQC